MLIILRHNATLGVMLKICNRASCINNITEQFDFRPFSLPIKKCKIKINCFKTFNVKL